MNGDKTAFLTIESKHEKEEKEKLTIKTENNKIIKEDETLKILGFQQNRNNTMDSHLNATAAKVGMNIANLKPALPYLSEKNRKEIITSKIKSIALYGIQIMIGQNQQILHKAESIIMRINRLMTSNPEGLRSDEAICKYVGVDQPRQDILKSNFLMIHKILEKMKPDQIINHLNFPNRICGQITIKNYPQSERSKRSPLYSGLKLYNAIPQNYRILPNKVLKKKLQKLEIKYSPYK